MTVSSQTSKVEYVGNNSAVNFSTVFPFQANEHVTVYKITLATNVKEVVSSGLYILTGAGTSAAGNLNYLPGGVPLSSAYKIQIKRTVPYLQPVELERERGFFPDVIEKQLDNTVMQIQQLVQFQTEMLPAEPSANGVLGFDANKNPVIKNVPDAFIAAWANFKPYFGNRAIAAGALIPLFLTSIELGGYSVERADAKANYIEVADAGPVEYYQFQTPKAGGGFRRWEISEARPNVRQFDGQGVSLIPTNVGIDDTIPVQKLMDYAALKKEKHADFRHGGGIWITTAVTIGYPNVTGIVNNQVRWTAGTFCAKAGSTGDTLVTVGTHYAAWEGRLQTFGDGINSGSGNPNYATRGWWRGITVNATRLFGSDWGAEGFKRDGMLHNGVGGSNVIASNFGNGRVRYCGAVPFGLGGAEATVSFTNVDRSASPGDFGSTGQTCVVTFASALLPELQIDDMVVFAEPADAAVVVSGTGVLQTIQLSEKGTQRDWITVTVGADVYTYASGTPTLAAKNYRTARKNSVQLVAPVGVNNVSVVVQRWVPTSIQNIAGDRLSATIQNWLLGNITSGTMKYAHGAGVHSTGGNTAGARFNKLDSFTCASTFKTNGLYSPSAANIVSQDCFSHITLGNPVNSFSAGMTVTSHHSEGSTYDLVSLSNLGQSAVLGAISSFGGTDDFASGGSRLGRVFQCAPLESDTLYSRGESFLETTFINYGDGIISPREGMTRGQAFTPLTLSNLPHNCFADQKLDTGTVYLEFITAADSLYKGYTRIVYEVFGSGEFGGPIGNTTIAPVPTDVTAGYTVTTDTQLTPAASIVVPPNKLTYPLRITAQIDRGVTALGKNWKVTVEPMAPMYKCIQSYTLDPAPFSGTQVQTVSMPGAVVGDICVAFFSIRSALWRVEGLPVTVADVGRFQIVEQNGGSPVNPSSGTATVGIRL